MNRTFPNFSRVFAHVARLLWADRKAGIGLWLEPAG